MESCKMSKPRVKRPVGTNCPATEQHFYNLPPADCSSQTSNPIDVTEGRLIGKERNPFNESAAAATKRLDAIGAFISWSASYPAKL